LQDDNPGQAAAHLLQALTIYQRIGAPAVRRVQQTIQNHRLTSTTPEPRQAAPSSEGHQPRTPAAPPEAVRPATTVRARAKPGGRQNSLIWTSRNMIVIESTPTQIGGFVSGPVPVLLTKGEADQLRPGAGPWS
jgi:hypothetical protein